MSPLGNPSGSGVLFAFIGIVRGARLRTAENRGGGWANTAGKALPFDTKHWPHVVLNGLEILNRENWFPVCTLIVGSPGETDEDSMATVDLLYEIERRGLHCMWVPSIFTPLVTRVWSAARASDRRSICPGSSGR
jgi:hypothetical protein